MSFDKAFGTVFCSLVLTSCPSHWPPFRSIRCDKFNKAYNHISERIDQVYKDLTKGKASPMGGVAYLSLEDTEVRLVSILRGCDSA